jgi:hypothetical protein
MRVAFLGLLGAIVILISGCSNDPPAITASNEASSDAALKRDCANPKWKQENLGLWYSVCRQSVHW